MKVVGHKHIGVEIEGIPCASAFYGVEELFIVRGVQVNVLLIIATDRDVKQETRGMKAWMTGHDER
jgi:hypothetical protein